MQHKGNKVSVNGFVHVGLWNLKADDWIGTRELYIYIVLFISI